MNWVTAENAVHGIIQKVRPTSESEERRKEVIAYIQRLVGQCIGVEVLPYGSVPLRTYLPDGDIDLTAFGAAKLEDMLVDDMKRLLQREEKNRAARFRIKDVQLIRAEVKLVKCIVQNIVVDISVNQIGGLCTLCFLEQIDRLIGKGHLFKSSIILIKAWCYYESRILGSHHGLISTYALETLVLYIFHLYHSTLDGPLAVLYKFLDYFSKFDWETYCISLNGPIRISSLPAVVVEMPEDSDENLLLTNDFMSSCVDMYSVPSRGGDQVSRGLQLKYLNIVDPLRESNNLGRSVSKGNFYRVRSAFTYGAKKLARILVLPEKTIASELHKFFSNTMARHGSNQRPDIQDFNPSMTCNGFTSLPPAFEMHKSDNLNEDATRDARSCPDNLPQGIDVLSDLQQGEPDRNLASTHRFRGDANELASSGLQGLKISKDSSKSRSPKQQRERVSPAGNFFDVTHVFFANSELIKDGNEDPDKMEVKCESPEENQLIEKHEAVAPRKPRDVRLNQDQVSLRSDEAAESLNSLTDLAGDYDNYLQHLQYGRRFYESGMQSPRIPSPNAPYQNNPWEGAHPPQFKRNGFSNQHPNGIHHGPPVFGMPPHMLMQGVPFGWEEGPNPPRGTGTYFPHIPNMNQQPHPRPLHMPMPPFCNGPNMFFPGSNMETGSHEPSQSQVSGEKNVPLGSFDGYQMFPPRGDEYPNSNGFIHQHEGIPEIVLVGHASRASMLESKQQIPVSSSPRTPSEKQKSQPDFDGEQDRVSVTKSYHLKYDDDFPPL